MIVLVLLAWLLSLLNWTPIIKIPVKNIIDCCVFGLMLVAVVGSCVLYRKSSRNNIALIHGKCKVLYEIVKEEEMERVVTLLQQQLKSKDDIKRKIFKSFSAGIAIAVTMGKLIWNTISNLVQTNIIPIFRSLTSVVDLAMITFILIIIVTVLIIGVTGWWLVKMVNTYINDIWQITTYGRCCELLSVYLFSKTINFNQNINTSTTANADTSVNTSISAGM